MYGDKSLLLQWPYTPYFTLLPDFLWLSYWPLSTPHLSHSLLNVAQAAHFFTLSGSHLNEKIQQRKRLTVNLKDQPSDLVISCLDHKSDM